MKPDSFCDLLMAWVGIEGGRQCFVILAYTTLTHHIVGVINRASGSSPRSPSPIVIITITINEDCIRSSSSAPPLMRIACSQWDRLGLVADELLMEGNGHLSVDNCSSSSNLSKSSSPSPTSTLSSTSSSAKSYPHVSAAIKLVAIKKPKSSSSSLSSPSSSRGDISLCRASLSWPPLTRQNNGRCGFGIAPLICVLWCLWSCRFVYIPETCTLYKPQQANTMSRKEVLGKCSQNGEGGSAIFEKLPISPVIF